MDERMFATEIFKGVLPKRESKIDETIVLDDSTDTATTLIQDDTDTTLFQDGIDTTLSQDDVQIKFQENASITWEVKNFQEYFHSYMDNEYRDGGEQMAVRTSLLHNGLDLDCSSLYLINLYLAPFDNNQNNTSSNNCEDIFLELIVKLVKLPAMEPHTFTNFKMSVYCDSLGTLYSNCDSIYASKLMRSKSVAGQINWTKMKAKMQPNESLFITVEHHMYRHPNQWKISSKAVDTMVTFMCSGKIEGEPRVIEEIFNACNTHETPGVVECLRKAR